MAMSIIGMTGRAGSGKDTIADILIKEHGFARVAFGDPLKRITRDVFAFTVDQLWGPSAMRNAPDKRYPREHGPWSEDGKCMCCGVPDDALLASVQCYLTPRHALQQFGTEYGRRCYPNVWVDYTLRIAEALLFDERPGPGFSPRTYDKHRLYNYHPAVGLFERAGNDDEASHGACIRGVVISDVRFPNEVEVLRAKGGRIWKATHGSGLGGAAGQHKSESYIDGIIADFVFPSLTLDALPGAVAGALKGP